MAVHTIDVSKTNKAGHTRTHRVVSQWSTYTDRSCSHSQELKAPIVGVVDTNCSSGIYQAVKFHRAAHRPKQSQLLKRFHVCVHKEDCSFLYGRSLKQSILVCKDAPPM